MNSHASSVNWPLGLIGAVVGGAVGYMVFGWLLRNDFYAVALPPAMVGIGCGMIPKAIRRVLESSVRYSR